jgi:hypothetical protein
MKLRLKEEPKEWLKFIAALCVMLALISFFLWSKGLVKDLGFQIIAALAAAALIACWIRPIWFRPVYRRGMAFFHLVGQFMGKVLLTVFFLFLLTPLGLALRLAGKDLLGLKREGSPTTFWREVKGKSRLDRMF